MSSIRCQSGRCRKIACILGVVTLVLTAGWALLLRVAPPADPYQAKPPGRQVFARDGQLLRGALSPDQKWRLRARLDEISPDLVMAVLEHEDRWFRYHPGVNPIAVVRAAVGNACAGRVVSGASTITMQLANLVDPRPRSYTRKLRQMFRALQYETVYSKDDILEMYLNLAPYGGNIEGVAAASRAYFGKAPAALSVAEAALLAVLPQSPASHNPIAHPQQALEARNRLIDRLERRGLIDHRTAADSRQRPLPDELCAMPFAAPHFCEWTWRCHPDMHNCHTTLDADLNARAQACLSDRVEALRPVGITQAAAVILDAERAELLVMVGSADFHDSLHAGQVNGACAPRSPGSALKPFVYALAFDRGLATPSTLVEDVPIAFGVYAPQNYDGRFEGMITAARALQTSRNVPAVVLSAALERNGEPGLHGFLRQAGVTSLTRPAEHYGLSLTLGGGEVTLLELAGAYATLARQGSYKELQTLVPDGRGVAESTGSDRTCSLVSPAAAYLVLQVLAGVTRPDFDAVWRTGTHQIPIPWKTGTSCGHRDAWAVGIAGPYVVAVWLGNFDGSGCVQLVGHDAAGPLLFGLIDLLPKSESGRWHIPPQGLGRREVCALSGAPAGKQCPARRWEEYIVGISPAHPCQLHRQVMVDTETGYAVCSRCRTSGRWECRPVLWWPPQVAAFLSADGDGDDPIPPHNPMCAGGGQGEEPRIISPQDGMEYCLRSGAPLDDQRLPLIAWLNRASTEVYWFLDGTLLWKGRPDEKVFMDPCPGVHRLTVKDDAGRSATAMVTVIGRP
jgi:penicillin-binding protein 1C